MFWTRHMLAILKQTYISNTCFDWLYIFSVPIIKANIYFTNLHLCDTRMRRIRYLSSSDLLWIILHFSHRPHFLLQHTKTYSVNYIRSLLSNNFPLVVIWVCHVLLEVWSRNFLRDLTYPLFGFCKRVSVTDKIQWQYSFDTHMLQSVANLV